eukprot:3820359-Rhodomonas_salina.2
MANRGPQLMSKKPVDASFNKIPSCPIAASQKTLYKCRSTSTPSGYAPRHAGCTRQTFEAEFEVHKSCKSTGEQIRTS